MENKNKHIKLSRRDFIKATAFTLGSAFLAACQQELSNSPILRYTEIPTIDRVPTSSSTPPPKNTDTPEATETEISTAIPTVIERFKLGSFDFSKTPFTLTAPSELQSALGFYITVSREYYADRPLPITEPYIEDKLAAPFDDAAKAHTENPYFVFLTDNPNHLFLYFHSLQYSSPGEFARILASFEIKKPAEVANILGQNVDIKTKDGIDIPATVSSIMAVPTPFVDDFSTVDSPWGVYPKKDNVIFARLDKFGLPENIVNDKTPGDYYITLVTCVPEDGNIVIDPLHNKEAYLHNTANRSLVTLKLKIGQ